MLKKLNVTPIVRDDDGSTAGLMRSLSPHTQKGQTVGLQLHGDPAPALKQWLEEKELEYEEILPYLHIPPDEKIMEKLLDELLHSEIDAAVFTSTPQARNLFSYARQKGKDNDLKYCFSRNTVALAVGKVTAQALKNEGAERVVYPEFERMGSAIVELANYLAGER